MKKDNLYRSGLVAGALVLALALTGPGCNKSSSASNTYTGEAISSIGGEDNPVKVTLTIEDGVITDATAEGPGETEGIGTKALEQIPPQIVEGNTINVDVVSGATVTSNAILEAAAAALESAGLNPDDYKTAVAKEKGEDVTEDVDIVIIGGGGAGMVAAITASEAGKSVVVLESQSAVGGNSVRATGGMNAAKTKYEDENEFGESAGVEKTLKSAREDYADNEDIQALADTVEKQWKEYQENPEGYFDSSDLFALDTMIGGYGKNNIDLVKTLTSSSADAIEWLGTIGADLKSVGAAGGASVKRIHRPVNDQGQSIAVGSYIIPILESTMEEKGVTLYTNTTAKSIIMDGDKAAGVEAERDDGSKVTVNADAVIIASGGFGANNEMVVENGHPELDGYITTNAAGILGQGIVMGEEVGADTVDMDQIQLHPTVHVAEDGSANLITEGLRGDGAILVNKEGKRFYDEVSTRDKVSNAENEQTDGEVWLIVDQKMYDASAVIQGYVSKGWCVEGDTAEELAKEMGVDEATLAETIETWNGYVEKKEDPDFGRTSFAEPLEDHYYALTVRPGIHHTMGGLKINTNAEVINTDGDVIQGLFAAGEVTGGVHGANRLGGNAVADFIVYGRIAGTSASEYVG